jgi:hypothetical protein
MTNYSITGLLLLFVITSKLPTCRPDLHVTPNSPNVVKTIYSQGGDNYCYFDVWNNSTSPAQFEIESKSGNQQLILSSVTPTLINNVLNPNESVQVKYQIASTFNPVTTCIGATACPIDKIRMRARWNTYNSTGFHDEEEQTMDIQWTNPTMLQDTWVRGGNTGDNDNFYQARLATFFTPSNLDNGKTYKFSEIVDVGNPNDFVIRILVKGLAGDNCLSLDVTYPDGDWVWIEPHTFVPFGQKIKDNFEKLLPACIIANDAFAYVVSPTGNYTRDAEGRKWIALQITHK